MNIRHAALAALALAALLLPLSATASGAASAKPGAGPTWIHPVIARFGGVHPRADAAVRPDPKANYRIFVDVVTASKNPAHMYESLDRLARLVNLMGYAKVPADHVHIAAVLDRRAAMAALTDSAYTRMMQRMGEVKPGQTMKNPNLAVLHALHKAGVRLMICSQAMAGMGLKDDDIDPSVTITLSALTDPVVYGQRGYTFMQL